MRGLLFFGAMLPLIVSAYTPPTLLVARTTCSSGDAVCGTTCIPSNYTCCPDKQGGCSTDDTCQKGDNGVYGCCPVGETCSGNGGAQFISDDQTSTTTASSTTGSSASATATSHKNAAGALGVSFAALAVGAAGMLHVL